jgi:ABC-type nitrate/sulfonate/bicarbonate transport system permease component
MCTPVVTILQPIPSLAWIPVAILVLGLGPASTLLIIFLAGVFPVILNTAVGVRSVDEGFLRAARMMGADQRTVFRRVLIPGAFPHMLSGFRNALANGWRSLIAAEMLTGSGTGLGYAIFQSRWNLDYASAFVNIILIAIAGLVCEGLVFTQLERRTVERWGLLRRDHGC